MMPSTVRASAPISSRAVNPMGAVSARTATSSSPRASASLAAPSPVMQCDRSRSARSTTTEIPPTTRAAIQLPRMRPSRTIRAVPPVRRQRTRSARDDAAVRSAASCARSASIPSATSSRSAATWATAAGPPTSRTVESRAPSAPAVTSQRVRGGCRVRERQRRGERAAGRDRRLGEPGAPLLHAALHPAQRSSCSGRAACAGAQLGDRGPEARCARHAYAFSDSSPPVAAYRIADPSMSASCHPRLLGRCEPGGIQLHLLANDLAVVEGAEHERGLPHHHGGDEGEAQEQLGAHPEIVEPVHRL